MAKPVNIIFLHVVAVLNLKDMEGIKPWFSKWCLTEMGIKVLSLGRTSKTSSPLVTLAVWDKGDRHLFLYLLQFPAI